MSNHNRVFRIFITGIYLIVFMIITWNLGYQYFMFDEAVQFWISKGLNPDSEPLSMPGGVLAVVENNKYYNMDPGGFGILLHFWAGISNHYVWLRLLPFIFYLAVIASFIYLSFRWQKNLNVALLMGFIPILYPMLLTMGFEVRAYSMETLGAILCVVSLDVLKKKVTFKNLFTWSCILALFMTSRYSLIIVVFLTSLFVLNLIIKTNASLKNKSLLTAAYGLPLMITLGFIYFNAFIYQNTNISPLIYIQYLRDAPGLMLTPQALAFLTSLVCLMAAYAAKNKYPIVQKYADLILLTIIVNVVFIILSLLGKHPWVPAFSFRSNRCISMITLMVLCYAALLGEILSRVFLFKSVARYAVILALLTGIIYWRKDALLPRLIPLDVRETESSYAIMNNVQLDLGKHNLDSTKKIYADWGSSPFIRYWYEYGPLRSEVGRSYPKNFTFTKTGRHGFYEGAKEVEFFKGHRDHQARKELGYYDLIIAGKIPEADKWMVVSGTNNFWVKCADHALPTKPN